MLYARKALSDFHVKCIIENVFIALEWCQSAVLFYQELLQDQF